MSKDDRNEALDTTGQEVNHARLYRTSEHAKQRQAEGRRIGPGYNDAQQAQQNDLFLQPNGRYVVRGPRGREHVFSVDGTHITSIDRSRRAHQRLVKLQKRTPVTLEQFQHFKELFK